MSSSWQWHVRAHQEAVCGHVRGSQMGASLMLPVLSQQMARHGGLRMHPTRHPLVDGGRAGHPVGEVSVGTEATGFVAGREDMGEVVFAGSFKDCLTVPLAQKGTRTVCTKGQRRQRPCEVLGARGCLPGEAAGSAPWGWAGDPSGAVGRGEVVVSLVRAG